MSEHRDEVVPEAEVAPEVEPEPEPAPDPLAEALAQRDEYLDQLRRVQAEFENYRKRILRQQTEHLERAAEALVEKLLPVLDTFDLTVAHQQDFEHALGSLLNVLEKEGLERIQPDGEAFDPNEHDAVAHEAAPEGEGDVIPSVSEVMRPGYRWKGRVVRPAMVRVKG